MSKTYTITSKQISDLHNAMCTIRFMKEKLEDMFKEDSSLVKDINYVFNLIEPVRKDLMDRKDADDDSQRDRSLTIADLNGFKNTIWSIYDFDGFDSKSPVPVGSKLKSYYSGDGYMVTVEGPTWLDLWKAADKLVKETSDEHGDHIFVEGFYRSKSKEGVFEVSLGS